MGVPTLGCNCRVCTSSDPRDQRLRPSVAIEWHQKGAEGASHRVLIDTGPDFANRLCASAFRASTQSSTLTRTPITSWAWTICAR